MIETVETDKTVYTVINGSGADVDKGILFVGHSDEYKRLKLLYDSLLKEAQNAFLEASKKHFMLEDIYSHNVSFAGINEKREAIIERINEVFCK